MINFRRGNRLSSVVAVAALLSHAQCTDSGSSGTPGGADGGGDLSMRILPQDPPSELAITSVNPPRSAQNQVTALSIGGTGFVQGATVTVSGVPCDGPVVSRVNYTGTLISCLLPVQAKTCGPQTIVVTNPDGKSVSDNKNFVRHPGGPAYAARVPLTTGGQPDGVLAADVNGDLKLDLIYATRQTNTIGVRLGNGDGTFGTPATYASGGGSPIELALADFNGDQKLDVAVANLTGNTVSLLIGDGTGKYAAPVSIGFTGPSGLAVGDVNGDGKMDVLVTSTTNAVGVFLGSGAGTLAAATPPAVPVGASPLDLVLGDINGDTKLDLIATNLNDNTISIRLGNGNGTFNATATMATNAGPIGIAIADLNADKFLDLVVANQTAGNASIYLGTGFGNFFSTPTTLTVAPGTRYVTVSDLNRDGLLDLAFTNFSANNLGVYLGNGQGSFAGVTGATLFGAGANPIGIAAGDFNGDGNQDLVASDFGAATLTLLLATEQCK